MAFVLGLFVGGAAVAAACYFRHDIKRVINEIVK